MPDRPALQPGFDLAFEELYQLDGLQRLDGIFHSWLRNRDGELEARLRQAAELDAAPDDRALAALIVDAARHLDDFLAQLFGIDGDVARLREDHALYTRRLGVRRNFVQRRAALKIKPAMAASLNAVELQERLDQLIGRDWDDERFADAILEWSANENEAGNAERLRAAMEYAAWAVHTEAGRARHARSLLFRLPHRVDPLHLIEGAEAVAEDGLTSWTIAPSRMRRREGFALQDHGYSRPQAQSESHYCVQCHGLAKDSCRTGMREPAPAAASATIFKKNAFGHAQVGCPLEERISEFHALRLEGRILGALAIITIDNPTVLMTGHRVCNECMQACIYQNQRQEPVNTPAAESRTLEDVLQLPWGFEILSLLTRWNPLKPHQALPAPPSGYHVLVVGMGPAGIGLSQHLLNAGHAVTAVDARPIESIDMHTAGFSSTGAVLFEPIRDAKDHARRYVALARGFGGTVESGLVGSRWDKTKLVLQRLLLERRLGFELRGDMRLGSALRLQEATRHFDHTALCLGAVRATDWSAQQAKSTGVRFALDFLSALQRGGASDPQTLHTLSLRLPVLIVGGGLTAIDAATEALTYYPVQVERFLAAYESLHTRGQTDALNWNEREWALANEYLEHARALRDERLAAAKDGRAPNIQELVQSWGGVRILYRRKLTESPAYTLNAEEVGKALEEGIAITEQVDGIALETEDDAWIRGVRSGERFFHAGSVLIAIGSEPDVEFLTREGLVAGPRYLQSCDEEGVPMPAVSAGMPKPDTTHILVSCTADGRYVSQLGDLHPSYAGNVVRALGSAKRAGPIITRLLARHVPRRVTQDDSLFTAPAGAADEVAPSMNAMDGAAMKLFAVVEQ